MAPATCGGPLYDCDEGYLKIIRRNHFASNRKPRQSHEFALSAGKYQTSATKFEWYHFDMCGVEFSLNRLFETKAHVLLRPSIANIQLERGTQFKFFSPAARRSSER